MVAGRGGMYRDDPDVCHDIYCIYAISVGMLGMSVSVVVAELWCPKVVL